MKIYTKTGDKGETALCGGKRTPKNCPRINVFGDLDELSSFIGLCAAEIKSRKIKESLLNIQKDLFILSSHIATPTKEDQDVLPKFPASKITHLEKQIDALSKSLKPLTHFILPGGHKESALLHVVRTICRRAERSCVTLSQKEHLFKHALPYLNRLSDLLFVLARYMNKGKDIPA